MHSLLHWDAGPPLFVLLGFPKCRVPLKSTIDLLEHPSRHIPFNSLMSALRSTDHDFHQISRELPCILSWTLHPMLLVTAALVLPMLESRPAAGSAQSIRLRSAQVLLFGCDWPGLASSLDMRTRPWYSSPLRMTLTDDSEGRNSSMAAIALDAWHSSISQAGTGEINESRG
jgi:hypothetical protein